jgi:predicted RNA-binding Zn-ribbon protein involved in translation (DUF1610 family)
MRVLVSCPQCKRRYKAEERKVGAKFRCRCGEVLEVRQPQARDHTAAVVRCSSCGGVREENARRCGFCGADFTLHERDLNTVCPNCLALVSDRAKYCSQCGERLSGEAISAEDSKFVCPACATEEKLVSRKLGKERINVLECQYCTGLWVGVEGFRELRDRVVGNTATPVDALIGTPKPRTLRRQAGPRYRKCVVCRKLMARRQYAKSSGVVIDVCRDHGIWFDPEELHQVLQWIAEGGRTDQPIAPGGKPQVAVSSRPIGGRRGRHSHSSAGEDFLGVILRGLFDPFV